MDCAVCGGEMHGDLLDRTFHCRACGFFSSTLPVTINSGSRIDENARERALKPVRLSNFKQLLDATSGIAAPGTLLDVGCAHGWFLQAAEERGHKGIGIEPDAEMAAFARKNGAAVIEGYFPDALPPGARYDLITFNDVFEHLPDVNRMADSIRDRLAPGGLTIINLPVSDGAIFRLSRLAARLGITGPLARMWQQGLPSPHLSYFSQATLPRLMERRGLRLVQSGPLTSIAIDGLYARIRYDKAVGAPKAAAIYAAARTLAAASAALPSDIQYFVFRAS